VRRDERIYAAKLILRGISMFLCALTWSQLWGHIIRTARDLPEMSKT